MSVRTKLTTKKDSFDKRDKEVTTALGRRKRNILHFIKIGLCLHRTTNNLHPFLPARQLIHQFFPINVLIQLFDCSE
jgi:hypothetical protein